MILSMKMHPKFSLFILQTILLLVLLCRGYNVAGVSFSEDECNDYFGCGDLKYIAYPFWGGNRTESCGAPGFKLVCQDDIPLLNIRPLSYLVRKMDFTTRSVKVARQDLSNSTCPSVLYNTTMSRSFSLDSNYKKITLFFNCTSNEVIPNQFSCDVDGVKTRNFFETGDASAGPRPNITCNSSISVPVTHEAAQALENTTLSPINALRAALASGFFIHWLRPRPCIYLSSCRQDEDSPAAEAGFSQIVPSPGPVAENQGSVPGQSLIGSVIGGLILGVTCTTILTIIICCLIRRQCWQSGSKHKSYHDIKKIIVQQGSLAPKRYKYSEIKKITKSFNDKLGQGGYGSVYRGTLPNGSLVAVKVLIDTNSNGEEFINEVASISKTSHVNVVNLLGFCYDGKRRALVYEFMPNKSLDKFISATGLSNVACQLNLEKLYKIAIGVAKGLEYLHTGCNTRIVHFDIKPQNILLDDDFCPKISDFGLAKLCQKKQSIFSMLGTRGTIGYIAPEVFSRNFGGVSHKCDVYSYGMMILEMVGARKLEENEAIISSESYFPDKIYEEIILDVARRRSSPNDFRIEEEEETTTKMFLVGFWCIQTNPSNRPSMSEVVEMLEGSVQSIQSPPKPTLFCLNVLLGQEISPS